MLKIILLTAYIVIGLILVLVAILSQICLGNGIKFEKPWPTVIFCALIIIMFWPGFILATYTIMS